MTAQKIPIKQRILWILNTLFHQVYAVVTVYILWTICYHYNFSSLVSWHILISTLAYVPLMGEAIILFDGSNVWTKHMDRTTKNRIHGVILIISGILVTIGISLMIDVKEGLGVNHFGRIHGWTGLVSWILILISQILGIAAWNAQSFGKPVVVKCIHVWCGLLGYIFGIVSLAYGVELQVFAQYSSREGREATYCLLGITAFWSILAALKSGYNQTKTILS